MLETSAPRRIDQATNESPVLPEAVLNKLFLPENVTVESADQTQKTHTAPQVSHCLTRKQNNHNKIGRKGAERGQIEGWKTPPIKPIRLGTRVNAVMSHSWQTPDFADQHDIC